MKRMRIAFRLLSKRPNAKNECPIFCRLTLSGQRPVEFSTGQFVAVEKWDKKAQRVIPKRDKGLELLNEFLDNSKYKLSVIFNDLSVKGESFTALDVKNKFLGKETKPVSLLTLLNEHIKRCEKLSVEKDKEGRFKLSIGRLKRYKVFRGKLITYLKMKKIDDINLNSISKSFFYEFRDFLQDENLRENTIGVYQKILLRLINISMDYEWIKQNPFAGCKIETKKTDRIKLDQKEINTLVNKEFSVDRLSVVRDVFVFCCYTGLAHTDVKILSPKHITVDVNGEKWIEIKRGKTNELCLIPILPQAELILNKYSNHPVCSSKGLLLPVSANQNMNAYLKEIADLSGINKHLTTHIARHTFCTTICLNAGISLEAIQKAVGHANIRTTQVYAKMNKVGMSSEFAKLKNL